MCPSRHRRCSRCRSRSRLSRPHQSGSRSVLCGSQRPPGRPSWQSHAIPPGTKPRRTCCFGTSDRSGSPRWLCRCRQARCWCRCRWCRLRRCRTRWSWCSGWRRRTCSTRRFCPIQTDSRSRGSTPSSPERPSTRGSRFCTGRRTCPNSTAPFRSGPLGRHRSECRRSSRRRNERTCRRSRGCSNHRCTCASRCRTLRSFRSRGLRRSPACRHPS